jgi:hypothetical protein
MPHSWESWTISDVFPSGLIYIHKQSIFQKCHVPQEAMHKSQHNHIYNKKFWEELIRLLSLRKSFILSTWTQFNGN